MFRNLTRIKQQLSREECIRLLQQQPRGVLSLLGDDGYPYGLPIDYWYDPQEDRIYFHSGQSGHKVDAIRRCDKASFCIYDEGFRESGDWALNIRSVIVFGRVRTVDDQARVIELTRKLSCKYTSDSAFIEEEIRKYGHETLVFTLIPEHMTGKITREA